jgi:hypothetical protein
VPDACTLPTAERPLRAAEFDALFAEGLRGQRRVSPTVLRWDFDPAVEAVARDLARRESGCCSFFRFTFRPGPDAFGMDVEVPAGYVDVLDALGERSAAAGRQSS